ncbi:dihydropteroate synthase [bacterium]|nr:dihydropteroate synthase [bacterium]
MHDFFIKKLSKTNIENELLDIGFDKSYIHRAKNKFEYLNLKIYNLTCAQANIIKQTALTVGADCATNRDVITGNIDLSNAILGGSISQLYKIAQKLQLQPFQLKNLGNEIEKIIFYPINKKTKIIGILNITQNSFSDGGKYFNFENAVEHLHELIEDGADIIDIGAESTKPGSEEINADKQLEKLIPILKYIKGENIQIPISIDTRNADVAQECIKYGANIINDVSGLDFDPKMIDVLAKNPEVTVIIQHSKGTPDIMQDNPQYINLMDEIFKNLKEKIEKANAKGIYNIIIDPGIGFGKTKEQNFEIIRRWKEFQTLGHKILIGLSRKSLIDSSKEEKDLYTLALNSILINQGIDYIRVHNVKIHKQLLNIIKANQ